MMERLAEAKDKGRSRFPEGMTERKARAKARTNTGVVPLRLAQGQDDGEKRATAKATTTGSATEEADSRRE